MTVPNIPGWTRLEECPRTIGCTAKVVWRDADKNLFKWDPTQLDFVPHECLVRGSEKPQVAYMAEWYNHRTGRTRWVGPERLERTVRKPPADKRNRSSDWELKNVYISNLEWVKMVN